MINLIFFKNLFDGMNSVLMPDCPLSHPSCTDRHFASSCTEKHFASKFTTIFLLIDYLTSFCMIICSGINIQDQLLKHLFCCFRHMHLTQPRSFGFVWDTQNHWRMSHFLGYGFVFFLIIIYFLETRYIWHILSFSKTLSSFCDVCCILFLEMRLFADVVFYFELLFL